MGSKNRIKRIEEKISFQGQQQVADPNVLIDFAGSTAGQVHSNQAIERSDAPQAQIVSHDLDGISIRELWNVAWQKLREEDDALIAEYEDELQGSVAYGLSGTLDGTLNTRDRMSAILQIKMDEGNRNRAIFKLGNSEVKISDAAGLVMNVVNSANRFITQAAIANPYGSIAWAGVSFLLPLFMNISAQSTSLAKRLNDISRIISQSRRREEFYVECYESRKNVQKQSHHEYKFKAKCCCYYSNNSAFRRGLDAVKWNDWDRLVNEIRDQDEDFSKIEQTWRNYQQALAEKDLERTNMQTLAAINAQRKASDNEKKQKQLQELLSWLCSTDPSLMYNAARDSYEAGTNEWLLKDSEAFETWMTTAGSLLWLHGKPGSGKSVLSSSVINYLKDQYTFTSSVAIAYFYFSFSDVEKQRVDWKGETTTEPQFIEQFGEYKRRAERPDHQALKSALIGSTKGFSAVYIIIDGLDESIRDRQREKFLKSLEYILSNDRYRSTLATDDFKSWLVEIKEEARESLIKQSDSMFQYVRLQLEELKRYSSRAKILRELGRLPIGLNEVYKRILENIDIRFRAQVINSLKWLAFSREVLTIEELSEIFIIDLESDIIFDEAERHFNPSDICKHFSSLIKRKHALGFLIYKRADAHLHIASSCLAYLTYLSLVTEKDTQMKEEVYPLKLYAARYWMFHLDKISFSSWPAKIRLSVEVALADYSQNLLLSLMSQDTRSERISKYMLNRSFCYTAYCGFRQLTEFLLSPDQTVNKYITQEDLDLGLQFAAYSGHLDIVQFFLKKGAITNMSSRRWNSAVYAAVSGGSVKILEFFLCTEANVNSQPALFVFMPTDDTQCLELLLDHGMNVNLYDADLGTALHKAIADEKGADVNALSKSIGTPLHAVCAMKRIPPDRRLRYVKQMLVCGADPNIRGGEYATALQAASCYSRSRFTADISLIKELVQLLIEHGADVNIRGGYWGLALYAAASLAHIDAVEVMELLLENGTALQVACNLGTIEAVRFLLDQGADYNAEGGRFGTSLQAAAARSVASHPHSKVQILKLLINKGADINQQGGEFGTALQAVCRSPNVDLIPMLLEYGADVDAKSGRYGTALIAVCGNRWTEPEHVQLLLDHGAHTNSRAEELGTVLIAVCERNPDYRQKFIIEIAQLLLDLGAEITIQGGQGGQGGQCGTALSAACLWGHSELIRLLLSRGADIHLRDCAAWHAATCYVAIRCGDTDVLELLLEHGMDINHAHEEYGTALHAMITAKDVGGNWRKGVDVSLKHHINPNTKREQSGSALHTACAIKHEDEHESLEKWCFSYKNINDSSTKTKHLLEKCPNIDVNESGGIFGSALQAAAYSGQILSVRLLLDRKARVNVRGGKYRSALNGAVIGGYWNIVKILLEAGAAPDCHLQEQPDEEWLQIVLERDGRDAVERYRKLWDEEGRLEKEA
ncbi:ankyrin repeat-containing domain protein [Trichoderma austrokoningii]